MRALRTIPAANSGIIALCIWCGDFALHRWRSLVVVVAAMLLKVGFDVIKPWPMVFLVDYVLQGRDVPPRVAGLFGGLRDQPAGELVLWCVAATVMIFLFSWAVGLANSAASVQLGQRLSYDLAGKLFAKLQQLCLRFHARHSVGDNIRRVTADCTCVSVVVKDAILPVISSLISLVVMFGIMWQINPILSAISLAVVPYMIAIFKRYAQPMADGSHKAQEVEGRIYDVAEQTFSAIPVIQAFTREDESARRFAAANRDAIAVNLALADVQLRFRILIGLATAMGTASILWLGTQHALSGQMTVGSILLFLSYLASLYAPLQSVMYTSSTLQGAIGSARRVWEVLRAEPNVQDSPGAIALPPVKGSVRFQNVTFGYVDGRPVLHEVNLSVAPGEIIALVGATGAGKTTLASLIPRFYDPWLGRVIIDGKDVRDVGVQSLRRQVGLVLQEPFLFPASIAENIAYGNSHATHAQVEAAARAANAHDFIRRLPDGYDTVIGERGSTLSGGERQRISIARALLKDAPLLILDEPTSALDAETEMLLIEALDRLVEGRTTFIIAHRFSTIRRATRIVVLNGGRLAEVGTHDQLIAARGLYAQLHALQFGASARNVVQPV